MDKRELRQALRLRNAIPDSGDGLSEHETLDECIRAGLDDICAESRWPWLLTSATLTFTGADAPLPADFGAAKELVVAGYPVPWVTVEQFLTVTQSFVFTIRGANVSVYPTPTVAPTTPTLWYYRVEPALTLDTSIPLLPVERHRTLVARASYHLSVRRGDRDRMRVDDDEWQAGLRNLMMSRWNVTGPRQIRSGFRTQQTARWS